MIVGLHNDDGDRYRRQREHSAKHRRKISKAGREIGPLPGIVNKERRMSCERDFAAFCTRYMPESFPLEWSSDHLKVISKIEHSVLHGGLFAMAMPRGSGKTTISEAAAIWSIVYGHHKFVCVIGAEQAHAGEMLDSIRFEFEENPQIYDDFPEVVYPVWMLEGIVKRIAGQTLDGKSTKMTWKSDIIVLPTVEGSKASGSVVKCVGLLGRVRGMKHKRDDGQIDRPSFVVVDDPQTDESALSAEQSSKRESVIAGAVLNLSGPGQNISGVMPCTVIQADDLADRILNHKLHPEWRGERMKMVYRWPVSTRWEKYIDLRRDEILREDETHQGSTELYKEHQEEMDQGGIVAWEARKGKNDISAIQHAFNIKACVGEKAFQAEYQNEPVPPGDTEDILTVQEIAEKIRPKQKRGQVPLGFDRITVGVDIQKRLLYYVVVAWDDEFTGHVLTYGAWPDQRRKYFHYSDIRKTITQKFPGHGLEGSIHAALTKLVGELLEVNWTRDDGAEMKIDRILIDANWGQCKDTVYDFCKQHESSALTPSHGKWYGAASQPITGSKKARGEKVGLNWIMPAVKGIRVVRHLVFDTNYWKSFVHARLATPLGDSGGLTLFDAPANDHLMFAEQCRSETREIVEAKGSGRVVHEWRIKPHRPDNHLFDCAVMAAVAASKEGCILREMQKEAPKRKPMRLSNVRNQKR